MDSILLIRVSTLSQNHDAQTEELKVYAEEKGFHNYHIIQDKESGYKNEEERNGLIEMKDLISKDKDIKAIFVWEISRLARSQKVLFSIREYLINNKINLYIKDKDYKLLDDNYNLDSNTDLLFNLYGYFAESEMKIKKERFKRGKAQNKLLGKFAGGKRLYGYNIEKDKLYVINEIEANEIKNIFDMYVNHNMSLKDITLNCIAKGFSKYTHSKRNVNKLIKEAAYTGEKYSVYRHTSEERDIETGYKKVIYETKYKMIYPAIISSDLFNKAQMVLKSNIICADKSTKHVTLLAKKIKCLKCGCYYYGDYRTYKQYDKSCYKCARKKHAVMKCNSISISMITIDSIIWDLTKRHISSKLFIEQSKNQNEIANMENQIVRLNEKLKSFDGLVEAETTIYRTNIRLSLRDKEILKNEYVNNIAKINTDKKKIEKKILEIQDDINNLLSIESKRDMKIELEGNIKRIESSKKEMKKYIDNFIKEIYIQYSDNIYTVLCVHFKNANTISQIYIVINKKDTNRKKVCYMYASSYIYDESNNIFKPNNESTIHYLPYLKLADLFVIDDYSIAKQHVFYISYNKLNIYG